MNNESLYHTSAIEVLLYLDARYTVFFSMFGLSILTYKSLIVPYYPDQLLAWDFISIFLYALLNYVRISIFSRGNRFSKSNLFGQGLVLTLFVVGLHCYWMLQYYVLRIDYIVNILGLFLVGAEILMGSLKFFALAI
jgi:hypothetical protein